MVGQLSESEFREQLLHKIVAAVHSFLQNKLGLVEMAREVSSVGRQLRWEQKEPFSEFVALDSESDHFPLGEARSQWAEDALSRIDLERGLFEEKWFDETRIACESLLDEIEQSNT